MSEQLPIARPSTRCARTSRSASQRPRQMRAVKALADEFLSRKSGSVTGAHENARLARRPRRAASSARWSTRSSSDIETAVDRTATRRLRPRVRPPAQSTSRCPVANGRSAASIR